MLDCIQYLHLLVQMSVIDNQVSFDLFLLSLVVLLLVLVVLLVLCWTLKLSKVR